MSITQGFREELWFEAEQKLRELWKLCAGPLIDMPTSGERVFYFPQGHLEQVEFLINQEFDPEGIPHFNVPSQILCRVLNIQLLAKPETDEIYACITLMPELQTNPRVPDPTPPPETHKQELHSVCQTLTVSDTSTHEGFLVLQNDAANCLPQLDMTQTPPTQELVARDLHGFEWKFRHTYRDQAKMHLLTNGWRQFVSSQRLNAGDAFLLLRGENDKDLLCGVKHKARQQSATRSSVNAGQSMYIAVLATASHAVMSGSMFTIYYKPRISQFIIRLNKYLEAINNVFVGTPFKMGFEGEDLHEISRFSGSVIGAGDFSPAWPASKWKSLMVQWAEPASIPRPDRASPWEIEPCVPSASVKISPSPTVKNKRPRPGNTQSSGTTSSSRMRVDGICPTFALLRISPSFSYEPRNKKAISSTQASVSGYDQVEDEEKSGNYKNI